MATTDRLTFEKAIEYWMFCTPDLLLWRYERAIVLASSAAEREVVVKMLDKYLTEAKAVARRQRVEGDDAGAAATDLVLQKGHDDRYAGPLRHGRFQVMESLSPVGTFYIADHTKPDLLTRENGPASNVRRFATREDAEEYTDRRSEGAAEPTQQESRQMAKPKKMETPPKGAVPKAAIPPAKKGATPAKTAAPTPAAAGNGKRGRKSAFSDTSKITLLKKENPKRAGSTAFKSYAAYKDGMTVAAFLAAGGRGADLAYDSNKGFIRIS